MPQDELVQWAMVFMELAAIVIIGGIATWAMTDICRIIRWLKRNRRQ